MLTSAGRGRMVLAGLLLFTFVCSVGPAHAGPKQAAALQNCKNIYDDQKRTCQASNNVAACMTMITDKYESCKADAETIVGLEQVNPKSRNPNLHRTTPGVNSAQ